jgi:hypothetical protein
VLSFHLLIGDLRERGEKLLEELQRVGNAAMFGKDGNSRFEEGGEDCSVGGERVELIWVGEEVRLETVNFGDLSEGAVGDQSALEDLYNQS